MSAAVCVVGATGATGTRVALLAAQAGLPVVLAGRNLAKLDLLAAELGGAEVRTVDLDRPESLDRALDGAAAVASCVGPFTRFGFPLAEAAVRNRVHYVDTNGEPRFCLRLLRELDGPARQAGVALAPAVGGSVAGDFAAAHALGAGDLTGARAVTLAYRIRGMRPSSGTLRSEIEITADGAVIVAGGALVEVPAGGPVRLLPNGPGVRFPIPDPVLVSRYCPLPSIEAYFVAPLPGVVGRVMRAAERVASRPAVRARLRHLAARLPETDDGCPHGVFSIAGTVWGPWGARTTTATASDIYGFTARSVVRLAGALASGHPAPVGDGGVRAPSQIVDDVEKAAVELGIRLEHRVTAPGEPVASGQRRR